MKRLSRFPLPAFRFSGLAAALLIAAAAAWPLLAGGGLLNTRGGGDSPFLLQRVQQLETAVLDGHFPVRWMPDANYGYGYPFFNFYAPLSIYIAALFRLFGFSYVAAIKLAQLAGFLTAAAGMFALARRWFRDEWAALLASAAYTLAPFHLVNVYVRGDSLAEFWAMAFYPLVILAADGLGSGERGAASGERGRRAAWLALAYAGLILSHNISAMIFSPFLLLFLLLQVKRKMKNERAEPPRPLTIHNSLFIIRYFLPSLLAILFAFALAAWFFVPALAEKSLAQLGPVTAGYFHFSNHFLGTAVRPLAQSGFFFDFDVSDSQAFGMGLVQAVTAVAGLIIFIINHKKISPAPLLLIALTFLTATFMLTPLSRPLWEHLPLLDFTQFPWRFLSVQAFAGALAAAGLAMLPKSRWIVAGVTAVLLISSLGRLRLDFLPLTDADVTAEKLAQYEWFTGNIGSTVSAEYLPQTMQPRPYTSPWLNRGERDAAVVLAGDVSRLEIGQRQAARQTWRVTAVTPAALVLPTMHWPGWTAMVDGKEVAVRPSANGLIELDVPAGDHAITLRLARTPVQAAAEWVSLLALAAAIWLVRPRRWPDKRLVAVSVGGLLLLAGGWLWRERPLADNTLTWDFAQLGYLHHDTGGIRFDDGSLLENYSLRSDTLRPGETLHVNLNWQPPPNQSVTLSLISPAAVWPAYQPAPPAIVSQTRAGREANTFTLAIPENAPAGLFVPRLILTDGRALTSSEQTRGDLLLSPVRVLAAGLASALAHPLDGTAVNVWQPDEANLQVEMAWAAQSAIPANYNVHLEMVDGQQQPIAQLDAQAGYGFLPSSGWGHGRWQNDWYTLALTQPLTGQPPYTLMASLYDAAKQQPVMTRQLGRLDAALAFTPYAPDFALPDGISPAAAVFSQDDQPLIELRGYQVEQSDEGVFITLYWQALADGRTDFTRFVHLTNFGSSTPLAQDDRYPGPNNPTGQWVTGQIVKDTVRLDVTAVPPGDYQLGVGFYQNLGDTFPRLTAVAANSGPLPNNAYSLPEPITLP